MSLSLDTKIVRRLSLDIIDGSVNGAFLERVEESSRLKELSTSEGMINITTILTT